MNRPPTPSFYPSEKAEHIIIIDGLFEYGLSEEESHHQERVLVDSVGDKTISGRTLCGVIAELNEPEVMWVSLIPTDEDYIIGLTRWLSENKHGSAYDLCDTCTSKATRIEQMLSLDGQ